MAANKPGRIVNISSTAHYSYNGGGAALYAVTKTAIARMTETLAMEWAAYNINVNCIAPGAFISEMVGFRARSGRLGLMDAASGRIGSMGRMRQVARPRWSSEVGQGRFSGSQRHEL